MKLLLSAIFILIITSSCQSKEEKAEKMAADYLKAEIVNYDTYDAVKTTIDSLYLPLEDYQNILKHYDQANQRLKKLKLEVITSAYIDASKKLFEKYDIVPKESSEKNSSAKAIRNEMEITLNNLFDYSMDKVTKFNKKDFSGWIVTHKFKCTDEKSLVPYFKEYVFICDKNFKNCFGLDKTLYEDGVLLVSLLKYISINDSISYDEIKGKFVEEVISNPF